LVPALDRLQLFAKMIGYSHLLVAFNRLLLRILFGLSKHCCEERVNRRAQIAMNLLRMLLHRGREHADIQRPALELGRGCMCFCVRHCKSQFNNSGSKFITLIQRTFAQQQQAIFYELVGLP
jgi:hypothetical protein